MRLSRMVTVCQYLTILSTRFLMFPASNCRKETAGGTTQCAAFTQYTYSMLEGGQFIQHTSQGPDVTAKGGILDHTFLPPTQKAVTSCYCTACSRRSLERGSMEYQYMSLPAPQCCRE